jgi:beta-lactamase regulating signal transducer with metallopeptidase domain
MNALISLIDHPTAGLLASSLVHFLWQGALLALVLGAWLRWAKPATAATRYLAGVLTLAAMLVAPSATFLYLSSQPAAPAAAGLAASASGSSRDESQARQTAQAPAAPRAVPHAGGLDADRSFQVFGVPLQVVVLAFWIAGVVTLSLRLFGGWVVARRLATRATRPVAPEIHALARRVAGRLALDRLVHIVESSVVRVPVMVGWLKPVVLLPASAMSGLTPTQIEALLAHELAHIRRHDYIVNLMQSAVETLLFYHPGVWWVSRQIRAEREHCADDLAVAVCDRLVYVSALADLAQLTRTPHLALAATDGSLLRRVRRLLSVPSDDPTSGSSWLPVLIVVLLGGAVVPAVVTSRDTVNASGTGAQVDAQTSGVRTGVPGGVPGGVVGGVPGGVIGGVVGGVPGGVSGGVPGGVVGGVPGGVVGGVIGGVPGGVIGGLVGLPAGEELADVQGDARQREQARELEERARRQLMEVEKALRELAEQRALLDQKAVDQEWQNRLAALKAQIAATEDERLRARQMYEQGLLSQSNVRELETQLQALRQRLEGLQAERELRSAEALFKRREGEQFAEFEKARGEYDKVLSELAGRSLEKKRDDAAAMRSLVEELMARQNLAENHPTKKEIEELVRRQLGGDELSASLLMGKEGEHAFRDAAVLSGTIEITAPNEAIRAGDVLTIDIAGEPDLPRTYVVEPDGTVRLPLVGTVRVGSLTTRQAREAVQKQLTDRRIEAREVTVGLRRPKEKDSQEPYVERQ